MIAMLESPTPVPAPSRRAFGDVGPNWFAVVMGTGIVANAAVTLPVHAAALTVFARSVWLLDVALLIVISLATAAHWLFHPQAARRHLHDPVMSYFYGAPAMALLTVGAGAVLLGEPFAIDAVLWPVGTLLGLWTAVAVPCRAFAREDVDADAAFGGWLMPVVPPMVSAATGPLLLPHLPAGQWQLTLQLACAAMFGMALVASLIVITMVWSRLVHHTIGAAAAVPTLWIVLGPLGQSITAAHNLAGTRYRVFGLVYGMPTWGFAMLWLALASAITVRTVRRGLPFSLTWWSFTFPVGTVVTGTSALAVTTGAVVLDVAAVVIYLGLLVAWLVVATRTFILIWSR